jgi:hypothetical protein
MGPPGGATVPGKKRLRDVGDKEQREHEHVKAPAVHHEIERDV